MSRQWSPTLGAVCQTTTPVSRPPSRNARFVLQYQFRTKTILLARCHLGRYPHFLIAYIVADQPHSAFNIHTRRLLYFERLRIYPATVNTFATTPLSKLYSRLITSSHLLIFTSHLLHLVKSTRKNGRTNPRHRPEYTWPRL